MKLQPKNSKILFIILFLISLIGFSQTTAIPDQQFEQILINEGIDSDGTLNGQVLTSDITGVLDLNLQWVDNLTGLQDFIALESLIIDRGIGGSNITVDLTNNINLKQLEITSFEGLSKLDLTGLTSLEELILQESQGDVITMDIDSLDLSTNTNIKKVELDVMEYLQHINLQNGNNTDMADFELLLYQGSPGPFPSGRPMCVKVDDATAATGNTAPYDSWTINGIDHNFYDAGQCTLSVNNKKKSKLALYPNPANHQFHITSTKKLDRIELYKLQGKLIKTFHQQETYDVSDVASGVYFVKLRSGQQVYTQKLIKN